MLSINVGDDPVFKEIYEQGNDHAARTRLLRLIGVGLVSRGIKLEINQEKNMAEWPIESLQSFAEDLMARLPTEDLLKRLT